MEKRLFSGIIGLMLALVTTAASAQSTTVTTTTVDPGDVTTVERYITEHPIAAATVPGVTTVEVGTELESE